MDGIITIDPVKVAAVCGVTVWLTDAVKTLVPRTRGRAVKVTALVIALVYSYLVYLPEMASLPVGWALGKVFGTATVCGVAAWYSAEKRRKRGAATAPAPKGGEGE